MNSDEARKVLAEVDRRLAKAAKLFGFSVCPACGTGHTARTIGCRACGYEVAMSPEDVARAKEED